MTQEFSKAELTTRLKSRSRELGFQLCGIAPAINSRGFHRLIEWLDLGYAGEMSYLNDRQDAYAHPDSILTGVQSIIMLGMDYHTAEREPASIGKGNIAAYAWGSVDYHDLIHKRLKALKKIACELSPESSVRGVVDTEDLPLNVSREVTQNSPAMMKIGA